MASKAFRPANRVRAANPRIDGLSQTGGEFRAVRYRLILRLIGDNQSRQKSKRVVGFLRSFELVDVTIDAGRATDDGSAYPTEWTVDCPGAEAGEIWERLRKHDVQVEVGMTGGIPRSAIGMVSGEKSDIKAMLRTRKVARGKADREAVGIEATQRELESAADAMRLAFARINARRPA